MIKDIVIQVSVANAEKVAALGIEFERLDSRLAKNTDSLARWATKWDAAAKATDQLVSKLNPVERALEDGDEKIGQVITALGGLTAQFGATAILSSELAVNFAKVQGVLLDGVKGAEVLAKSYQLLADGTVKLSSATAEFAAVAPQVSKFTQNWVEGAAAVQKAGQALIVVDAGLRESSVSMAQAVSVLATFEAQHGRLPSVLAAETAGLKGLADAMRAVAAAGGQAASARAPTMAEQAVAGGTVRQAQIALDPSIAQAEKYQAELGKLKAAVATLGEEFTGGQELIARYAAAFDPAVEVAAKLAAAQVELVNLAGKAHLAVEAALGVQYWGPLSQEVVAEYTDFWKAVDTQMDVAATNAAGKAHLAVEAALGVQYWGPLSQEVVADYTSFWKAVDTQMDVAATNAAGKAHLAVEAALGVQYWGPLSQEVVADYTSFWKAVDTQMDVAATNAAGKAHLAVEAALGVQYLGPLSQEVVADYTSFWKAVDTQMDVAATNAAGKAHLAVEAALGVQYWGPLSQEVVAEYEAMWGKLLQEQDGAQEELASRAGKGAAAELEALRMKHDALYAAQKQYKQALAELDTLRAQPDADPVALAAREKQLALGFEETTAGIKRNQEATKSLNLSRNQMLELNAAGVNSFQALMAGMNVQQVAMMEGAQVIGAFAQGEKGFAGLLTTVLSPIVLVTAAVVAMGAAFAYAATSGASQRKDLENSLVALGSSKTAWQEWASSVSAAKQAGVSSSDALSVSAGLGGMGAPDGVAQRATQLIRPFAQGFTDSDKDAAEKQLIDIYSNPVQAMEKYRQQIGLVSQAEAEHIRWLELSGDRVGAVTALYDALSKRLQGVQDNSSLLTKSIEGWSLAFDRLGTSVDKALHPEVYKSTAELSAQPEKLKSDTNPRTEQSRGNTASSIQEELSKRTAAEAAGKSTQENILAARGDEVVQSLNLQSTAAIKYYENLKLVNASFKDMTGAQAMQALSALKEQFESAVNPAKAFAEQSARALSVAKLQPGYQQTLETQLQVLDQKYAGRSNIPDDELNNAKKGAGDVTAAQAEAAHIQAQNALEDAQRLAVARASLNAASMVAAEGENAYQDAKRRGLSDGVAQHAQDDALAKGRLDLATATTTTVATMGLETQGLAAEAQAYGVSMAAVHGAQLEHQIMLEQLKADPAQRNAIRQAMLAQDAAQTQLNASMRAADVRGQIADQERLAAGWAKGAEGARQAALANAAVAEIQQQHAENNPAAIAQITQGVSDRDTATRQAQFAQMGAEQQQANVLALAEYQTLGMSNAERAKALAILQTTNDLQARGADLAAAGTKEYIAQVGAMAEYKAKLAEVQQAAQGFADTIGNALGESLTNPAAKFSDTWNTALKDIQKQVTEMTVVKPFKDWMTGGLTQLMSGEPPKGSGTPVASANDLGAPVRSAFDGTKPLPVEVTNWTMPGTPTASAGTPEAAGLTNPSNGGSSNANDVLYAIAKVESDATLNPRDNQNRNGTHDIGTWQINSAYPYGKSPEQLKDVSQNLDAALQNLNETAGRAKSVDTLLNGYNTGDASQVSNPAYVASVRGNLGQYDAALAAGDPVAVAIRDSQTTDSFRQFSGALTELSGGAMAAARGADAMAQGGAQAGQGAAQLLSGVGSLLSGVVGGTGVSGGGQVITVGGQAYAPTSLGGLDSGLGSSIFGEGYTGLGSYLFGNTADAVDANGALELGGLIGSGGGGAGLLGGTMSNSVMPGIGSLFTAGTDFANGNIGGGAGTLGGAALGTAILPGIGTAIGGMLGGMLGGMFGSSAPSDGPVGGARLALGDNGLFGVGLAGGDNGFDPTQLKGQVSQLAQQLNQTVALGNLQVDQGALVAMGQKADIQNAGNSKANNAPTGQTADQVINNMVGGGVFGATGAVGTSLDYLQQQSLNGNDVTLQQFQTAVQFSAALQTATDAANNFGTGLKGATAAAQNTADANNANIGVQGSTAKENGVFGQWQSTEQLSLQNQITTATDATPTTSLSKNLAALQGQIAGANDNAAAAGVTLDQGAINAQLVTWLQSQITQALGGTDAAASQVQALSAEHAANVNVLTANGASTGSADQLLTEELTKLLSGMDSANASAFAAQQGGDVAATWAGMAQGPSSYAIRQGQAQQTITATDLGTNSVAAVQQAQQVANMQTALKQAQELNAATDDYTRSLIVATQAQENQATAVQQAYQLQQAQNQQQNTDAGLQIQGASANATMVGLSSGTNSIAAIEAQQQTATMQLQLQTQEALQSATDDATQALTAQVGAEQTAALAAQQAYQLQQAQNQQQNTDAGLQIQGASANATMVGLSSGTNSIAAIEAQQQTATMQLQLQTQEALQSATDDATQALTAQVGAEQTAALAAQQAYQLQQAQNQQQNTDAGLQIQGASANATMVGLSSGTNSIAAIEAQQQTATMQLQLQTQEALQSATDDATQALTAQVGAEQTAALAAQQAQQLADTIQAQKKANSDIEARDQIALQNNWKATLLQLQANQDQELYNAKEQGGIDINELVETQQDELTEIYTNAGQTIQDFFDHLSVSDATTGSDVTHLAAQQALTDAAVSKAYNTGDISSAIASINSLLSMTGTLYSTGSEVYADAVAKESSDLKALGHALGIPGYATGTTGAAPGLAWVGEKGPEIVQFRGGETVYNAEQSRAMFGPVTRGYATGTAAGNDNSDVVARLDAVICNQSLQITALSERINEVTGALKEITSETRRDRAARRVRGST
jgi:hypothetical protein